MSLDVIKYLSEYDGPEVNLMEVCGTHTAEISHCGIPSMLSPKIHLVSGPGCPVCVTVTDYIDKLIALAKSPQNVIVTFGDMLRVTGKTESLSDAKGNGAQVIMVYSPMETLDLASNDKTKTFIFAAIGFETTTPIYALMIQEAIIRGINNIKILTSLKTMPSAIDWVCQKQGGIDGFLAPGHVSAITGSKLFDGLAKTYGIPFAVAGFEGEQILKAIAALIKSHGQGRVMNLYPSVVTEEGNEIAQQIVNKYFVKCDAPWRGFGIIKDSGMILRDGYKEFDAGSEDMKNDQIHNPKCRCAQVLTGCIKPTQCPLFGNECTPQSQQGACMVSSEGSCFNYYINKRK